MSDVQCMSSRTMPVANRVDMMIMIGQLIGIRISGSLLLRFEDLDCFAMRRIRPPVNPPEMTPPIPRMSVNVTISNWVVRM